MKYTFLIIVLILLATPAQACEAGGAQTANVKVNGLICDFCAQALEKVFGKREEVKGVRVDLDKGLVSIDLKPGQNLDDATLKSLITDSGYDVSAIERGC